MHHTPRLRTLGAALALALSLPALAQTTGAGASTGSDRASFIPYTNNGYIGLSAGQSRYDLAAGPVGAPYDDTDSAFKITTGGYFHPNWAVELGYLHAGRAGRLYGNTRAQGLNLSLVGRAPLGESFDVFGKLGTTYGWTRTTGSPGLGVATGKDDGFGLAYGAGLRWNFTPQWSAVLEWERHRMRFADGRADVDLTTLGVQYRY